VQFWVDAVDSWEQANKKRELIGLSTTKDVQDAILADSKRSPTIDIIDIRYWHYQADGTAYAPAGGQNLAPRQQARLFKPKSTSFEQVYRAVKEYRQKYPSKAVIYSGDGFDRFGWAAFIGGGSLPVLPATTDKKFLAAASGMKPDNTPGNYVLSSTDGLIAWSENGQLQLDLSAMKGNFKAKFINARDGKLLSNESTVEGGKKTAITLPNGASIIWLTK
jgi:hypothetical protein